MDSTWIPRLIEYQIFSRKCSRPKKLYNNETFSHVPSKLRFHFTISIHEPIRMPFETLDYHLKQWVTWFQEIPRNIPAPIVCFTILHRIISLRYYQSYVLYPVYVHNLPYARNIAPRTALELLTMPIPGRVHTRYHLDIPLKITPIQQCARRAYERPSGTQPVDEIEPSTCPIRMGWPDSTCSTRPYTPRHQASSFPARSLIWTLWLCCVVGWIFWVRIPYPFSY